MTSYVMYVHKDDDSAFGLTFPNLPGCFAASDTWEGIQTAAAEALELYFDCRPGTEPPDPVAIGLGDIWAAMQDGAAVQLIDYERK